MSIPRSAYLDKLRLGLSRSPVVALLGPRQCGKTTLARMISTEYPGAYFDLESRADLQRLENPEYVLGRLSGLIVIDEIQIRPDLFATLRVLADRPSSPARFLILGSAAPTLIQNASESLAGRIEFVDLHGFDISETGAEHWESLWVRGGFPRSYLAANDENSMAWREGLIRSYLQQDIPGLGIRVPAAALRRFWTILAHYHGRAWNASAIATALGLSDKTVRHYLDILSDTYMVRQLQPWHENVGKRQVKAPKIYFRDSGLLHTLLSIPDHHALLGHAVVGFSWEGFALEQVRQLSGFSDAYYWGTYGGAELDMLVFYEGNRIGFEFKFSDSPGITRSMHSAITDLKLERLWVIAPVKTSYALSERISVCPLHEWSGRL